MPGCTVCRQEVTMNKEAVITIPALKKQYGSRVVLQLKNWHVYPGRITAIIGPSGAGKSTLLRLINLLELPTAGRILYFGGETSNEVKDQLSLQRRMTMVFQ